MHELAAFPAAPAVPCVGRTRERRLLQCYAQIVRQREGTDDRSGGCQRGSRNAAVDRLVRIREREADARLGVQPVLDGRQRTRPGQQLNEYPVPPAKNGDSQAGGLTYSYRSATVGSTSIARRAGT